ncbi:MAG TPA: TonB-dependent receptor [Sphingobium sp.]|nr:TonB-dependent receptor [Sphingobium sp.]
MPNLRNLALLASVSLGSMMHCSAAFAAVEAPEQADQAPSSASPQGSLEDIVVTAQKRSESINKVGMSINAASSEQLVKLGVTDISQLAKIVPGFAYNVTAFGLPVYTIRGVGYQESSLAAGPAVSVYVNEVPLPYAAQTLGATLDLERVEVLKGPQGTLFGSNATGGAINYIAAQPTDRLSFGVRGSYGRFNTTDLAGFVSGPLTSTLSARLALRSVQSNDWQKSYSRSDTNGSQNQLFGRLLLNWQPTDSLKIGLNLNAWRDRSDTQAPQLIGKISALGVPALLAPEFVAFPLAPERARAADWDPDRSFRNNNRSYQAALRIDYDLSDDITLTALSSYQKYKRFQPVDVDGTPFDLFYLENSGHIETFFEELRLAGKIADRGNWLIGANYQHDDVFDNTDVSITRASQRVISSGVVNRNTQKMKTYAAYANVDYEILDGLKLLGGLRYTKADRSYVGCSLDPGDGSFSAAVNAILPRANPAVPGGCISTNSSGEFGLISDTLNQHNISWRAGVNYEPQPGTLLYANVSKGYKAGSFPNLTVLLPEQVRPVTQESLLAYEVGFKAALFDRSLQLNGAAFYYDYTNKQVRGVTEIPPIGTLETLVNIPKSHVVGFELSANWRPFDGLTIAPSITLTKSKIKGPFINGTSASTTVDFGGQPFPYTPKWSGNTDAEYRWNVNSDLTAFVGGNVSYQTSTNGSVGQPELFRLRGYALLDLRAGISGPNDRWTASIWGRNVTNVYYWTAATRGSDAAVRYAGMPVTYGVSFNFRY